MSGSGSGGAAWWQRQGRVIRAVHVRSGRKLGASTVDEEQKRERDMGRGKEGVRPQTPG